MIEQFENYLRAIRGLSENTALAYGKDLHSFAKFLNTNNRSARWSQVSQSDIDQYIIMLSETEHKASTICRHISSISAFYRWAISRGLTTENPARYESRPKVESRIPNTLSVDVMNSAIAKAHGQLKLVLCIIKNTGARIQEALDIKTSDIELKYRRIRLHGKGAKERYVYVNDELMEALQNEAVSGRYELFCGITQEDVRFGLYDLLRGVDAKQKSPHAFRHSFASELARQGANVAQIAALMGHNDIRTTQKYIDMNNLSTQSIGTGFRYQ